MSKVIHSSKDSQIKPKGRDSFSRFFHTASKVKKTEVFIKAAEKANKDQQHLVKCANLKLKGA